MSTSAERIQAAKERDEEGIEQDETTGPKFEGPENPTEPEPTPGEPEPEPEPEPTPEPEAGAMDAEQAAELEKATTAYMKRVEKVFGAGNAPPACPACEGLGFDLTGGSGQPDYATHEQYIECHDCHGLGFVKTGSQVMGHDLHECPKCVGRGYLEKLGQPQLVPEEGEQYGTPAWMGNVQPGQPV
jgi:hypothetical protein